MVSVAAKASSSLSKSSSKSTTSSKYSHSSNSSSYNNSTASNGGGSINIHPGAVFGIVIGSVVGGIAVSLMVAWLVDVIGKRRSNSEYMASRIHGGEDEEMSPIFPKAMIEDILQKQSKEKKVFIFEH